MMVLLRKSLFCLCFFPLSLLAQGYQNPVIPGFYPDPSICRVGNDYYLVNSSFEYFPGVPIWHSNDLIHWQQIGNVLSRASQLPLRAAKPSNGIYAPTIRYHKGTFYMVTTLVGEDKSYQNFYVTATNPAGPWSNPIYIAQNGIDPSLFFDDDGKVYFLSNRATKPTDERAIYQSEIDIVTGKLKSSIKQLWKGSGGSYVEGPHMYKKDGLYYLLTAEGGTAYGHSVAISRSASIWGPFESCPHNPILTNRMSYDLIQGTGHADLVQAPDSSWWMVHLAFRPAIDGIHFIGRETCLTPVSWPYQSWPIVNKNGTTQASISQVPPGFQNVPNSFDQKVVTDFGDKSIGLEWLYLRNPDSACYSLSERKGFLRLRPNQFQLNDLASPAFLARRQQHFNFSAQTVLNFSPRNKRDEAGLSLLMTNRFHYDFFIGYREGKRVLNVRYVLDSLEQIHKTIALPNNGDVRLKIVGSKKLYKFYYSIDGSKVIYITSMNTRFLGTEVTGGYNGVLIGLYAAGAIKEKTKSDMYADFDWFEYQPL